MSWDALSLPATPSVLRIAGVSDGSDLRGVGGRFRPRGAGLPPLPASVRRIRWRSVPRRRRCRRRSTGVGVGAGVELWVDVGERATAAEVGRWLSGAGVDADSGPPTAEHAADAAGRARELCEVVRALLGVSLDGCRGRAGAGARLQRAARAVARLACCRGRVDAAAAEERGGGGRRGRGRPPRTSPRLLCGGGGSAAPPPRAPRRSACSGGGDLGGTAATAARCALLSRRRELVVGQRAARAARVGRAPTARHR